MSGYNLMRLADDEIKELLKSIKSKVENKFNKQYKLFDAIAFTINNSNGINYNTKVRIDIGKFIHVKFFQPNKNSINDIEIIDLEENKKLDHEL